MTDGVVLYTYLPLTFFTGSHRMLNFKNFKREIIVGLLVDFFCFVLPIILLQSVNNATINPNATSVDE